ncbi:MAG: CotH kinase family protein [Treponema sp.]|nr:CotH kinase family protein [Treponema sp.]
MRKYIFSMLLFGMIFGIVGCAGGSNSNDDVKNPQDSQNSKMPVIKITANYLATSEEDGFVEKNVNDFVKLPVAKSVKEQTAGQDWAAEYAKAPDPFYKASTITVINEDGTVVLNEVEGKVKVRGNWTTTYKKKPLRIKFDEKQSMLGLNEGNDFKNWVLLASFKDRSFLRDITGFTLGKELSPNYYTSDFKLVEVYVNGEYFGVYILAEQQEVKKNRINIDDAEENPSNETGYLIEYDRYYEFEDEETVFELKHGSEVKDRNGEIVSEFNIESNKGYAGYTIKNDLNNAAQRNYIANYMQTLWDECYAAVNDSTKSEADVKAVIEQYIDVQSLVDTYLLQEIVCDPDLYLTSFFMTLDMSASGNKKLTFQAPWDFDSTMGNKKHDANVQGLYAGVVGYDVNCERIGTGNPWMMLLVNQPWFNEMVKEKWNAVKESVFSKVTRQITSLTSEYSASFEKNYRKWPMEPNDEYRPAAAACNTQREAANQLKNWLNARRTSLEKGINNFEKDAIYKAQSEHMKAYPDENGKGIVIEVKFPAGKNIPDYASLFEEKTKLRLKFYKNESWDNDGSTDCMNTAINSGKTVKLLFPFTEAEESYTFKFENVDGVNESIRIKAKDTVVPIDLSDFYDSSETTCKLDGFEISTSNNKKDVIKNYLETKEMTNVEFGVENLAENAGYAGPLGAEWISSDVNVRLDQDKISKIRKRDNKYASGAYFKFRHPYTESDVSQGILLHKWECQKVWSETQELPDTLVDSFERFQATPTENGILVTFKLKDGESVDYSWSGIKEKTTGLKNVFKEEKLKDNSFTALFPYVEAGQTYEFFFDGQIYNVDVPKDLSCVVTSIATVKPLDVSILNGFYKSTSSCVIEDDDYFIITNPYTNVKEMFDERINSDCYNANYGFVWGHSDWSEDTTWGGGGDSNIIPLADSMRNNKFNHLTYCASVCYRLTCSDEVWETNGVWSDEEQYSFKDILEGYWKSSTQLSEGDYEYYPEIGFARGEFSSNVYFDRGTYEIKDDKVLLTHYEHGSMELSFENNKLILNAQDLYVEFSKYKR